MKHIDKVFKEKLYNQKAPVPEGMWDKIAPALEEESGRSLLWFWFAGIMTLLLATIAYVTYTNSLSSNSTSPPLASEITIEKKENDIINTPNLKVNNETASVIDSSNDDDYIVSPIKTTIDKKSNVTEVTKQTKSNNSVITTDTKENLVSPSLIKVEEIKNQELNLVFEETVNTDNLYGKPANLVITKSYLSDNGSIVKQSNVSTDKNDEPSYNVFINSEGLSAGALLRIVEPLENIPLPAFSKQVKKKIK